MSEDKRTELHELGEFGTIELLTKSFQNVVPSTVKGVGDDAAVIERNENEFTLISTDLLLEGVHFNLMYMPFKHLGYKAVVVNLSDIIAMNGKPEQITVSLAVSNRFPVEALEELYEGIHLACSVYNVDLVGGDTSTSNHGLMLSVTAVGVVEKERIVYRTGSKQNDLIVVTGDLGAAYMGLQVLERERNVFEANPSIQPDLDGFDYIIERQLKPEARKDVIQFLKELDVIPTSMMDISDGLASEVMHLCKASGTGARIYNDKLPIDSMTSTSAIDFNLDPVTCVLNGGEDYELIFTVSPNDYEKIKGNPHMSVVGYMTDHSEGIYLVDKNDSLVALKAQGWNHFE
ncbi:MAG: thiamine-phosphate kinase [Fluviicola sp.]|nr:thiamine-phosphate kinase [Fluviicola sp.]